MARLSIRLFGYPRVFIDDAPVKVERRKTLALAAYLAVEGAKGGIAREQIADLLWPDCFQEQAGAYLRQALWDFSKAAGSGWLVREEQTVMWDSQADVWVDVNAFSTQLERWRAGDGAGAAAAAPLSELAGLYQNDFLAGFTLSGCPAFDDWQVYQSETQRLRLAMVLEALTRAHSTGKRYDLAGESARRWLGLDPLNEDAHQALMRVYAGQGDRGAVLRQYETLTRILADELGIEPSAETKAVYELLRDSAAAPAYAPIHNLPVQMTPFFGREEELARIEELLGDPNCHLITLVGMGGSGKTRLAIQAGAQSRGFMDGAAFVGLAAVATFEQMLPAMAAALKVAFQNEPGANLKLQEARGQLLNYLGGKQLLIVLDNFEQLTGSVDFLSELLDAAPGVKLLVTSRERLNLRGETVVEVGGLAYPQGEDSADAIHYAGVQLFAKSAARAGRFNPGPADWRAIIQICRLVDGVPLGVEMAAAWTRTLSCAEIAAEIERDLDFLQASWGGMPQRQRTFRAVFEHSWRLLSPKDRAVFCRLSIFQGSFSRGFALEVGGATLSTLTSLIDKSLLRRLPSGRFEIHPVLRQYCAQKLAEEAGMLAETRRRYAAAYGGWLGEQFRRLKGDQQLAALTALRGEGQDLMAAWRMLVEERDLEAIQSVLPAVILFNVMNDRRIEMLEFARPLLDLITWLQYPANLDSQAAATNGQAQAELLSLALAAYRHFTIDNNHHELTIPYQKASLEMARDFPENYTRAFVLLLSSIGPGYLTSVESGDCALQSEAIFKRLNDTWGSAMALMIHADNCVFGEYPQYDLARRSYLASLEGFDRLSNDWGRAICLNGLSFVERQTGHYEESLRLGQQSLDLLEQLDNQERIVPVRHFLGEVAEILNDLDNARAYYRANLTYYARRGEARAADLYQERLAALGNSTR